MKKINITQLENDLLGNRELQEVQGGIYPPQACTLTEPDYSADASTINNPPPPPKPPYPGHPWDPWEPVYPLD